MTNELVEGVTYVTYVEPKFLYYSDDNGQVITERPKHCTSWKCQRWDGERRIAPALVKNQDGFNVCSSCGLSYGR